GTAEENPLAVPAAGLAVPVTSFRKRRVKFSWDLLAPYQDVLGEEEYDDDEDMLQAYEEQLARLKKADEMTRSMTQEEYMYYSECRQASFTYKKLKRFHDWSGLAVVRKEGNERGTGPGFAEGSTSIVRNDGPFQAPPEQERPLEPTHVHEAFRRMQRFGADGVV
ncbi:hypothetical protein M427DRAFT_57362, partial [Gonapodya prolifera JEL478]